MVTRRSFLRSLVSVAVATQLPNIEQPKKVVETLVDKLNKMLINGSAPVKLTLTEISNKWIKVDAVFKSVDGGLCLNFTGMNDGMGLAVMPPNRVNEYLRNHPEHVVATDMYMEPVRTNSLLYSEQKTKKVSEEFSLNVYGMQVEEYANFCTISMFVKQVKE